MEIKLGGIFTTTFLILLTLKLLNKIALSWFWVIAPLWLPVFLVFLFFFIAAMIGSSSNDW